MQNNQRKKSRERDEVMFRLWYSYWLERIAAVFNRRLDAIINILILAAGAFIVAGWHFGWVLGAVVVVLGACNFICRFGQRAQAASEHAHRYNELITKSALLSTEALLARLPELEMHDSPVLECMENVTYNKACMSLNISHRESLSFAEKMMAAITIGFSR
ncbi:TPA: hypothetical protein ACIYF7_003918 [Escherichia coli]